MIDLTTGFIPHVELYELIKSLLVSVIFALILSFVISRYSHLIGDRSQYTIVMLTLIPTMVLIITIVKSSLALSLGLVGALSIVRFRTPIKEPEELVYLFIAISVGLGLGANQRIATTVAFLFTMLILVLWGHFRKTYVPQGMFIELDGEHDLSRTKVDELCQIFRSQNVTFELKRYTINNDSVSATFFAEIESGSHLDSLLEKMRDYVPNLRLAVIDRTRHLT